MIRTLGTSGSATICVACAVLLAVGALLIALDARRGNDLVSAVLQGADAVDLGVFERNAGPFDFDGEGGDIKNAWSTGGWALWRGSWSAGSWTASSAMRMP